MLSTIFQFLKINIVYLGLALVVVLETLVLSWSSGTPIGGDLLFPFNPALVGRYLSAWNGWVDTGTNVPYVLAGPPLFDATFFAASETLGLSLNQSIWLFFGSISYVGAAGTCYLLHTIFPHFRRWKISGFISGLAFLYSPLYVVDTYKSLFLGVVERSVFPIIVAFYVEGLRREDFRYSLGAALLSFLELGRFPVVSARYGLAVLSAMMVISGVWIISSPKGRREGRFPFSMKSLVLTAVLILAVNAYWIIPYLELRSSYASTLAAFPLDFSANRWSTLTNSIRLLGSWPLHSEYVPYGSVYSLNLAVIVFTFVLPITALSSAALERGRRVILVTVGAILLIFLSKGTNEPFGFVFSALTSFSVLKVFYISDSFEQFLLQAYCIMIGVTVSTIFAYLWKHRGLKQQLLGIGIPVLLVVSILIAAWPITTGTVMTNYFSPNQRGVTIPSFYYGAARWLDDNAGSSRVLIAHNPSVYESTDWGFQGATEFYQLFFNSRVITGTATQYSSSSSLLRDVYNVYYRFTTETPIYSVGNVTFRTLTNSTWASSQSDSVEVVKDGSALGPYLNWKIGPNPDSSREISKQLSTTNWTLYDALALRINGTFQTNALSVGIGDSDGLVGWYYFSGHIRETLDGWSTLFLPLMGSDESRFNANSVASLFLRYTQTNNESASISLADFHLARISYESTSWAKTLGLLGVRYILEDRSLLQGRWTFPILNDTAAFSPAYASGPIEIYRNFYAGTMLYSPSKIEFASSNTGGSQLTSIGSFTPNESAFVTDSQIFSLLNSTSLSPAMVKVAYQSSSTYRIDASARGPFVIILSENFDPNWNACDSQGNCFSHFYANGFGNGWYIPIPGSYEISITDSNQTSYTLAFAFSLVTIAVLASTLLTSFVLRYGSRKRAVGMQD